MHERLRPERLEQRVVGFAAGFGERCDVRGGLFRPRLVDALQHPVDIARRARLPHRRTLGLFEIEKGSGPKRDAENYFVSIFGKPDLKGTWGFRWEGHHLSLNFTLVDGELVSSTPSFFATNPGKIKDDQPGPVGFELLKYEDDLGRQLAKSLTAEQRKQGFLNKDPFKDIVTGNKQKADGLIKHQGIAATALTAEQKQMLGKIVYEYVSRARPDFAARELQAIDAVKDSLVFAWNGGLEVGEPHYYSIQGPTFLFEMANFQGGANHVHASWRDLKKDFAYDPLREHAKEHAAGK